MDLSAALRRARAGEEQWFADLYRAQQAPLVRDPRLLAGQDAEDVAAETFLPACRDLRRFRGDAADVRPKRATASDHMGRPGGAVAPGGDPKRDATRYPPPAPGGVGCNTVGRSGVTDSEMNNHRALHSSVSSAGNPAAAPDRLRPTGRSHDCTPLLGRTRQSRVVDGSHRRSRLLLALVGSTLLPLALMVFNPVPAAAGMPRSWTSHGPVRPGPGVSGSVVAELAGHGHARVCGVPSQHQAVCQAVLDLNVSGAVSAGTAPYGYSPGQLQAAYSLPSAAGGAGRTVAVVDAYDAPTAAQDLATYRAKYGLPPCGAGCFTKVNENGATGPLPAASAGWAQEISLDLDMVSAACPNCHILLLEAASTGLSDLGTAVNTAVAMGAVAVSNSYDSPEYASEVNDDAAYFNHPGVAITASAGDNGYGVQYPAASRYVTAVGGTSLIQDSTKTRGYAETAWGSSTNTAGGTGSGCSSYEPKPKWQHDPGCASRTVVDVSAVADPATGVAVYDSTVSSGVSGWLVMGGTSVGAPLIAGTYALAPPVAAGTYPAALLYQSQAGLHDVTAGSDGVCTPLYLCTAGAGYDGPTALGSPNGVSAFSSAPAPATYRPVSPARVLDTRAGTGAPMAPVSGGQSLSVAVTGIAGVPATGVGAVVLNVTVTQPGAAGFITAYPAGSSPPLASDLNFTAGETVPNLVVVPVGANGNIDLYNGSAGSVQLVADIAGYYLN